MDVNFTDFDLRSPVLTSDFIVGYKQDSSTEYRALVSTFIETAKNALAADLNLAQILQYDLNTNNLTISNGNTVNLNDLVQSLTYNPVNQNLSIAGGNTITLNAPDRIDFIKLQWNPPTDYYYLTAVDFAAPFSSFVFNTSLMVFQLANPSSETPAARVFIMEPGYYEFHYQMLTYSVSGDYNEYTFKLLTSETSTDELSTIKVISKKCFKQNYETPQTSTLEAYTLAQIPVSGYYTVSVNISGYAPLSNVLYSLENNIPTVSLLIKRIREL